MYKQRKQGVLLVLWLLCWCTLSDITINEHADPLATIYMQNTHELNSIQKKAQINHLYLLSGQYFKTLQDLVLEIDLAFSQLVFVKYHLTTRMGNQGAHFFTQLQIDGKCASVQWYQTHTAADFVYLPKGRHTLKVTYHCGFSRTVESPSYWGVAYVKARYYAPGKQLQPKPNVPKKITKTVETNPDFFIINNKKWQNFPDLTTTVNIPYDQEIQLSYLIITATEPSCQFAVRLKIDDQVNKKFNGLSWKNQMHQIQKTKKIWLTKGVHLFKLEYKSGGLRAIEVGKEYQTAFMEIEYHEAPEKS